MFKNKLQELAQRSCFNLPSYACIREGPDHAPRFRASVNFNGEIFESPTYCPTLRQAEHAAAEVALNVLSSRGPSRSLTARVLDDTGIYKNLLQETAHRAGLNLPVYTTVRSGPGHVPIFTCTIELAGMNFTGEPAKTKKQAEKNAAISAWSSLKKVPNLDSLTNKEVVESRDEQDQAVVARVLSSFRSKDDNGYARRRDHSSQTTRRRMIRLSHCSVPSSPSNSNDSSLHYPHWRPLDLVLDSALDGLSTKKQNSFVSLIPPPPPRTTSMILPPPTCPRENPSSLYSSNRQVRGKSLRRMQDIPIPLDEHQKDEDEWLGCGAKLDNITKKPIEKEASSSTLHSPFHFRNVPGNPGSSLLDHHTRMHKESAAKISSRIFGSSLNSSPVSSSGRIPRPVYSTGGFSNQRMAPAVQIRSVIPVCAAPPSTTRPPPPQQQKPPSSSQIPVAEAEENHNNNKKKTEDLTATPIQVISSAEFNYKLQL